MRRTLAAVIAGSLLLVAGCGSDDPAAPEVSISDTSWDGDTVTIEAATNLPNGAVLSWYVLDGGDWDDLDAADVNGFATVEDGAAAAVAEVGNFTTNEALVDVGFVGGYDGQPPEVADAYGPPYTDRGWPTDWKERSSDEATVTRP